MFDKPSIFSQDFAGADGRCLCVLREDQRIRKTVEGIETMLRYAIFSGELLFACEVAAHVMQSAAASQSIVVFNRSGASFVYGANASQANPGLVYLNSANIPMAGGTWLPW